MSNRGFRVFLGGQTDTFRCFGLLLQLKTHQAYLGPGGYPYKFAVDGVARVRLNPDSPLVRYRYSLCDTHRPRRLAWLACVSKTACVCLRHTPPNYALVTMCLPCMGVRYPYGGVRMGVCAIPYV